MKLGITRPTIAIVAITILSVALACLSPLPPDSTKQEDANWSPKVKQIGDPKVNYVNVEFTTDGNYMVWFEGVGGSSVSGFVWHCAVNQETGDLIPPDGRGFKAFESNAWARANPGYDKQGPYYIGSDINGKLIMVRPDGPYKGEVTTLPTPADTKRRAIYPTSFTNRSGGFVLFIQNEKTPGAGTRANNNSWVELQYINLSDPATVHSIERQEIPNIGFAPMDIGFVRWMGERPIITYGSISERTGKVEIGAFDADNPSCNAFELICDNHNHIDPYPAVIGEYEYILTGIDATATSHIYRRAAGQPADTPFDLFRTISPQQSRLVTPALAQSHEPFVFNGKLYTVYQVNDRGRDFFETTFCKPGEIWLASLTSDPVQQWLIAPDKAARVAEPEPLVTQHGIWVFYSCSVTEECPLGSDGNAVVVPRFTLYRAEVPMIEYKNK